MGQPPFRPDVGPSPLNSRQKGEVHRHLRAQIRTVDWSSLTCFVASLGSDRVAWRLASAFSLGSKTLFHECEPPSAPTKQQRAPGLRLCPQDSLSPAGQPSQRRSRRKPQESPPEGPLLPCAAPVVCWWHPPPGRASPVLPRTAQLPGGPRVNAGGPKICSPRVDRQWVHRETGVRGAQGRRE